jgi:ATP-dependent Clp protease adapter protein ClpS
MRRSSLQRLLTALSILLSLVVTACHAFSPAFQSASPPRSVHTTSPLLESPVGAPAPATIRGSRPAFYYPRRQSDTRLYSSLEKTKVTKKSVLVKDRTETKPEEQKKKEEQWRVVLHNDEVHTFNYVIRSLCKVIGTLDRKAAFEICVQTHGIGKATITKTWKKQAEQFCLGLQRQGLTVSISPDEDFEGGHSGGGL